MDAFGFVPSQLSMVYEEKYIERFYMGNIFRSDVREKTLAQTCTKAMKEKKSRKRKEKQYEFEIVLMAS